MCKNVKKGGFKMIKTVKKIVKLYDIRERDYPNKRGDTFRSLQVFECPVCKVLSNKVVIGGCPGYGVRVVCPNSSKCWHHELQENIEWLAKREIKKEIVRMTRKIPDIKNDIKGNPNMTLLESMTNTFSRKLGSSCAHALF